MNIERDSEFYQTARDLFDRRRYKEALDIYERLANAGDPRCQVHIGWMYHEGLGVAADRDKALGWFQRAASLGSKEGAFYYGRALSSIGRFEEAVSWFRRGAAQDYSPALLWLGLTHVRGLGVSADLSKGIGYLRRAADLGNILAKRELALLMTQGKLGLGGILTGPLYLLYAVATGLMLAIFDTYSEKLKG